MAGIRGPKPKPTHLKLVTGTARADRLNAREPKVDAALPMPPHFLADEAKVEWGRVADEMYACGILTRLDRAVLAAYCQAYARWLRAEVALSTLDVDQFRGLFSPHVTVANKAMADMVKYAAELGLTPSARSRVISVERDAEKDPASKYLA